MDGSVLAVSKWGEFLMADYLVTDTELTSVADAIRTKGGTSSSLSFPTGFVSAIGNIPSGGGSSFALVYDGTVTANTTSTTSSQVGTDIAIPRGDFSFIFAVIRDTQGYRNQYHYGTDNIIKLKAAATGSATISYVNTSCYCYGCSTSGAYFENSFGKFADCYGVYVGFLSDYSGNLKLRIYQKYNTQSKTINGTYSVKIYTFPYPVSSMNPYAT